MLSDSQMNIWDKLSDGPKPLEILLADAEYPTLKMRGLDEMVSQGLVAASAFTPTDALSVLGIYRVGQSEASRLGAEIWARRIDADPEQFCRQVAQQVELQLGRAIINSALAEDNFPPPDDRDKLAAELIDRAISGNQKSSFSLSMNMNLPLIALGAPVGSYFPALAKKLNASLNIPAHADTGNALGAVVGSVVQKVKVLIQPIDEGETFCVHLPSEMLAFTELDEAVVHAEAVAEEVAHKRAVAAGTDEIEVQVNRFDRIIRSENQEEPEEVMLEVIVTATATGRPRLGV